MYTLDYFSWHKVNVTYDDFTVLIFIFHLVTYFSITLNSSCKCIEASLGSVDAASTAVSAAYVAIKILPMTGMFEVNIVYKMT